MSERICRFLIDRNYIAEEDRELYTYAIFNLLFRFAPFTVIIPFCILTHSLIQGVLVSVSFIFLRKYSGGYHCPTPLSCFVSSSLLMTSLSLAGKYLPFYQVCHVLFPLILLLSLMLAPAETQNKTLSVSERKYYKKHYAWRCLVFAITYYGLGFLHYPRLSPCLLITMILVTVFQIFH